MGLVTENPAGSGSQPEQFREQFGPMLTEENGTESIPEATSSAENGPDPIPAATLFLPFRASTPVLLSSDALQPEQWEPPKMASSSSVATSLSPFNPLPEMRDQISPSPSASTAMQQNTHITVPKEQWDNLLSDIAALRTERARLVAQVASLQKELLGTLTERDALTLKLEGSEAAREKVGSEVASLREERKEGAKKLASIQADHAKLAAKLCSIQKERNRYAADLVVERQKHALELQSERAKFAKELAVSQGQVAHFQEQVKKIKDALSAFL